VQTQWTLRKKFTVGWIAMNTMCALCPPFLPSSLSLWEVPASHCCFLKCGNYACDQLCTCTCVVCNVWFCARAQLPLVDVCTSLSEACTLGFGSPGAAVCQIQNAAILRHSLVGEILSTPFFPNGCMPMQSGDVTCRRGQHQEDSQDQGWTTSNGRIPTFFRC
jgi:hypothetical protein